jgi:hypothetical protein
MNTITPFTPRHSRGIERLIEGIATSDGAGVKLTRVLTGKLQQRLDPFLMLDAFGSDNPDDYIAGFPDHPHRGFETITYMLAGRMRHRDSAGHEGLLGDGGVQWMTAGRGVIHSEIPEQKDGVMEGFQLWLNLPASSKMIAPWYRDIGSAEIPEYMTASGVKVRLIAGNSNGAIFRDYQPHTECLRAEFSTEIPSTHNAFIYVYRGSVQVGETAVSSKRMGILDNAPEADGITLTTTEEARMILVAGKPLNEPIVQYGPFVMNTQQEVELAVRDFRNGRLL